MASNKMYYLFTILMSIVWTKALAYDIAVKNADGVVINYNFINNGTELEVTYKYTGSANYDNYRGKVIIPEKVEYMNNNLKVTSIGESSFYNCHFLSYVVIPNTIISIGKKAFYYCSSLTAITIPNSVTSIGDRAFEGCSCLTSITIPNSVTSIGNFAFHYCSCLTSITIPNSVTSIGDNAFEGCSGLTSITIPNSVTSIGRRPFQGCIGLTSISVEQGNTYFDSRDGCNAIIVSTTNTLIWGCKNTVIPNSVMSIDKFAFSGCTGLTSITIPNSVTSIDANAFSGCTGLTSISVEQGNTHYDSRDNCNGIIETETNTLLYGCQNTTIPTSVTKIERHAFSGCSNLKSITIPNNVTSIKAGAFDGCEALTSITIEAGNTKYDSRDNCNGIIETETNTLLYGFQNTTIPTSVTRIRSFAFSSRRGPKSITIPNSVTSIEMAAFIGCSGLTSVTIGNNVRSIGPSAFVGCHISEIISKIEKPFDLEKDMFSDDTYSNATLYVPMGTIKKYKAKEGWMNFQNIKEGLPSGDIDNGSKSK